MLSSFNADPDPTFHFDADPDLDQDPDPVLKLGQGDNWQILSVHNNTAEKPFKRH